MTGLLATGLLLACLLLPAAAAAEPAAVGSWEEILRRAADAARSTVYAGEALWITWVDGAPHVTMVDISNASDRGLVLQDSDRYTMHLGSDDGGLVHHGDGWLAPLPVSLPDPANASLEDLAAKYDVELLGTDRLLDRRCVRLEIRRRADDRLRERLWVDEASGLLLRRESYDGDVLLRLGTYLSLDLRPARRPAAGTGRVPTDVARSGINEREQQVAEVDRDGLAALVDAGWVVPDELPDGYRPAGVYAVAAEDGQPLQIVYGDGMYTVSLFQQPGRADIEMLPEGAQRAEHDGGVVWEWPGAMPHRMVWDAGGVTYSLVGDAPPDEFAAIAAALPAPDQPGLWERLRRGLGRLWGWMSPWSDED